LGANLCAPPWCWDAEEDDAEDEEEEADEEDCDVEASTKARKPSSAKASSVLRDVCICFTGRLSQTRAALESLVRAHGGCTADSVTRAVTHLICSPDQLGTAKHATAVGRGLPVCSVALLPARALVSFAL